jgi:hypothetical protein
MVSWNILRTFAIFYSNLVYVGSFGMLSPFWYIVPRRIWQPCLVGPFFCYLCVVNKLWGTVFLTPVGEKNAKIFTQKDFIRKLEKSLTIFMTGFCDFNLVPSVAAGRNVGTIKVLKAKGWT